LISIQPQHVEKIIAGAKRWEFRRVWPTENIDALLIYATAPTKRIMAVAEVGQVVRASKSRLWDVAGRQGGITRRVLFDYLAGKQKAVCVELTGVSGFGDGIEPHTIFGDEFRAPQSFRYLSEKELSSVKRAIRNRK
jgi:predicted transcriptional regulator